MASTYTTNIRLTKQGDGDNANTWGEILNNVLSLVDQAVGSYTTITVGATSSVALTENQGSADQSRSAVLEIAGHAGYNAANSQDYLIKLFIKTSNGSSGGPNGQLFNSWYERTGGNSAVIEFKWNNSATNDYDLYMFIPPYSLRSWYSVKKGTGTWENAGTSATDPGANSSTVLKATGLFNILDANVGIGTTSPSQELHVVGNLRVTGAYYDSNNSAGTSGQVLSSTASGTDWVDVLTGSGTSGVLPKWNSAGTALIDSGLSFPIGSTYADFVLGASGTTTVRFIGNASSTGDFSIKNTTGDIYLQANNTTATTARFTTSLISLNEDTTISGYLRVQGSTSSNLYIGNVFGPSDTNTGYRINHSSLGCFIDVRNDVDKIIYRDYPDAVGTINSRFEMNMSTGTFTASGNIIAYGSPSDKRLKENIKPIESALDKVSKLQGVTFNWKKSDSILNIKEDVGFIAQDVQKVIPELVREDKDGMLSIRHQGITPILLEAIKELKAEIEELKLNKCNCNK